MGSKTIFSPPVRLAGAKDEPPPIHEDQAFTNIAKELRKRLQALGAGSQ